MNLPKLKDIQAKAEMTMLSDCCVDKTCRPAYAHDGKQVAYCTHQYGVNRGYSECASMSSDALAAFRKLADARGEPEGTPEDGEEGKE